MFNQIVQKLIDKAPTDEASKKLAATAIDKFCDELTVLVTKYNDELEQEIFAVYVFNTIVSQLLIAGGEELYRATAVGPGFKLNFSRG